MVWAYENMYTLCPKCSSSRWQGIDVAEKRILKVTCRQLNVCLSDVLEKKYETDFEDMSSVLKEGNYLDDISLE